MQKRKFWDKDGLPLMKEKFDDGGMFTCEQGVFMADGNFYAYVKDGWGAGGYSKPHGDQQAAMADIVRLRKRYFG